MKQSINQSMKQSIFFGLLKRFESSEPPDWSSTMSADIDDSSIQKWASLFNESVLSGKKDFKGMAGCRHKLMSCK